MYVCVYTCRGTLEVRGQFVAVGSLLCLTAPETGLEAGTFAQ